MGKPKNAPGATAMRWVQDWLRRPSPSRDNGSMPPFRTHATWLSDDDLILLDVMFDGSAMASMLGARHFLDQWNMPPHGLSDEQLQCRLRWLCEHGVLDSIADDDGTRLQITAAGGELWSRERCPVWERYCTEKYRTTRQGLTLMTVVAVSPEVRDDFLRLWLYYPARRRTATIADVGLIPWRPFGRLYVGMATYQEITDWSCDEHSEVIEACRGYSTRLEEGCTWWRTVGELQRFVKPA